jgi:hypothetical protein
MFVAHAKKKYDQLASCGQERLPFMLMPRPAPIIMESWKPLSMWFLSF